ncbi:hypothetical protein P5673_030640 [Acropora cervicornis]|uniref:Integrase n=1 Tax=Acropora cervicornis TaxID=6130 RepID=A0AAD9PTW4_ACRCE|nr:hypothetical protein P5673_030640 [Acropora cervicornis]
MRHNVARPLGHVFEGLPVHHALAMGDYRYLGRWARCAFASKVAHLPDPELRKLADRLPLRAAKAKAPSTTERYSRAFQNLREWPACFEEFACLSSDELSIALY